MKLTTAFLFASSITLAACGSKSSGGSTMAAGPTCDGAAANLSAEMNAQSGGDMGADGIAKVSSLISQACTEDGWSSEAVKCFAESQGEALQGCESMLTPEAKDSLGERMAKMMGSEGGMEGGDDGMGEDDGMGDEGGGEDY